MTAAELTEGDKRALIAGACGLLKRREGEVIEYQDFRGPSSVYQRVAFPDGSVRPCYITNIPDYFHSLDAMHDAEKVLTTEQCEEYWQHVNDLRDFDSTRVWKYCLLHATAAQRAEAFGKAVNLW